MPMIPAGYKTFVRYPDGNSKVITLYVRPVEGQIIAHGWEVTEAVPSDDATFEYRISVARPTAHV
jgi:hypothetical protein